MWVWQPEYFTKADERDKMLDFCTRQGFNRLLVQIEWKKGTAQEVNRQHKDLTAPGSALHPEIDHAQELAALIAKAAERGIAIEALDGDPYMGDKAHHADSLATVVAILAFNKGLPDKARFVGLHWDIEPYSRPEFKQMDTRLVIETDYLDLLAATKKKLDDAQSGMTLSVDIPMWYDMRVQPGDSCVLTWNGQEKNIYQHVEDICDYVGIMSYRTHAIGANSAAWHCENEMAYAEQINKFVVPAFETTKLDDEPKITFYGHTADDLTGERQKLEDYFKDRPGFGGMFLHCYPAVAAVLEPTEATK